MIGRISGWLQRKGTHPPARKLQTTSLMKKRRSAEAAGEAQPFGAERLEDGNFSGKQNPTEAAVGAARKKVVPSRQEDGKVSYGSYGSRPFDLIREWEIKDFFETESRHSPEQVRCEAFSRTADSPHVGNWDLLVLDV